MLYDSHLDIFLKVAEAGSFSKAANDLFITPSAVIKQINLFEKNLGVTLFERSPRGLQLTAAGRSLKRDAEGMIAVCNEAEFHAKEAMLERDDVIRIGMSPITPIDILNGLWGSILSKEPRLHYQMIPFDNNKASASRILSNLGSTIDIVTGIVDRKMLEDNVCSGTVLRREPLCIGVSRTHPLSLRSSLKLEDLEGNRLMMPRPGHIESIDRLRTFFTEKHPGVQIEDADIYTVELYNQCHETRSLLLSLQEWSGVHPMIRIVPVEWGYDVPYGLLYAREPSSSVLRFIEVVSHITEGSF